MKTTFATIIFLFVLLTPVIAQENSWHAQGQINNQYYASSGVTDHNAFLTFTKGSHSWGGYAFVEQGWRPGSLGFHQIYSGMYKGTKIGKVYTEAGVGGGIQSGSTPVVSWYNFSALPKGITALTINEIAHGPNWLRIELRKQIGPRVKVGVHHQTGLVGLGVNGEYRLGEKPVSVFVVAGTNKGKFNWSASLRFYVKK